MDLARVARASLVAGAGLGRWIRIADDETPRIEIWSVAREVHIGQRGCRRRRWPTDGLGPRTGL